jgi:hypothetical protein
MRMAAKHRQKHLAEHLPAQVQRLEFDVAAGGEKRQRRVDRSDVPAGVAARKLIAGTEINAAIPVQIAQQTAQSAAKRNSRSAARDGNTARRFVSELLHGTRLPGGN